MVISYWFSNRKKTCSYLNSLFNTGALFTEDDIEERVALEQAVNRVNSFNASRVLKNIEIQPIIKTIQHTDILDIKEKGKWSFY